MVQVQAVYSYRLLKMNAARCIAKGSNGIDIAGCLNTNCGSSKLQFRVAELDAKDVQLSTLLLTYKALFGCLTV